MEFTDDLVVVKFHLPQRFCLTIRYLLYLSFFLGECPEVGKTEQDIGNNRYYVGTAVTLIVAPWNTTTELSKILNCISAVPFFRDDEFSLK